MNGGLDDFQASKRMQKHHTSVVWILFKNKLFSLVLYTKFAWGQTFSTRRFIMVTWIHFVDQQKDVYFGSDVWVSGNYFRFFSSFVIWRSLKIQIVYL